MTITDRNMRRREFLAGGSAGLVAAAFTPAGAFAGRPAQPAPSERVETVRGFGYRFRRDRG